MLIPSHCINMKANITPGEGFQAAPRGHQDPQDSPYVETSK